MAKTIFITGASTGLGHATALLFAERGWRVIATMRHPEHGSDLAGAERVTVLPLDVTDAAEIEATARRALALSPVDVLFNNAGYGLAGPLEGTSDEQIRREIDTNLLGAIRTTQAFLPHFRERRAGVVITTTSIGGLVAFPFSSVYQATKWALEGWSESMAFELAPFGVRFKTVAPGVIKTDFFNRSMITTQHAAYKEQFTRALSGFTAPENFERGSSPEQIAEVVFDAATDDKDQLRYVAGADARATYIQRLNIGSEEFHRAVERRFLG